MDSHYVIEAQRDIAEKSRICWMCKNKDCTKEKKHDFLKDIGKMYCEDFQYPRNKGRKDVYDW